MITRSLPHLLHASFNRDSTAPALSFRDEVIDYATLNLSCHAFARGIRKCASSHGDRVAVYLGKSPEAIVAMFGSSIAECVFVPVNPVLKSSQVKHILADSGARYFVTNSERLIALIDQNSLPSSVDYIILVDSIPELKIRPTLIAWDEMVCRYSQSIENLRNQESDLAAILYTSGSTGKPKGVVLSHGNMAIGAISVAHYLENSPSDRLLSILPLSFDAGFSQISTAFSAGAQVHLLDYLLPKDVANAVSRLDITGITGVPPVWQQIAGLTWAETSGQSLRYFANTGGKMPLPLLGKLREIFPKAKPFLMYGLTEAFRSTYLDPAEVDRKPESIGRAIPNVRIDVINNDGVVCKPFEVGELVHSGPLVAQGYWDNPEKTAKRFKPTPNVGTGTPIHQLSVWSGDQVYADEEGFLYFVGRDDEMIKTSGYRVSPTEIEDAVMQTGLVREVAAFGQDDEKLGQVVVIFVSGESDHDSQALIKSLNKSLPRYMVPSRIVWIEDLPKNPNGKLDRSVLKKSLEEKG